MTISAKVIAHSVAEDCPPISTLQLRYPKFIHAEFMTHRVFSRNASSSRAIPIDRLIADVISDPVYPSFWGKNQPGMSAKEECNELMELDPISPSRYTREEIWDTSRQSAIRYARIFSTAGYHKQIVNRLLEPFCHINVVVTATDWDNFFFLRIHPDAQPEIRILAEKMKEALEISTPEPLLHGQWHTPYVNEHFDWTNPNDVKRAIKVSVARCARVSYLTQEGKKPNIEEDLKLYDRLVGSKPLHASPAEHQASPDRRGIETRWEKGHLHGNLNGWIQYRKTLPGENGGRK